MKYHAIFLSDHLPNEPFGYSRYCGPYKLASELEGHGHPAVVIDYVMSLKNPVEYILSFVGPETKLIGLSTTFLSILQARIDTLFGQGKAEANRGINYYWPYLWTDSDRELAAWIARLKEACRKINPGILFVVGGAKATAIYDQCSSPPYPLPAWYGAVDYFVLGFSDRVVVELVRNGGSGIRSKEVRGIQFIFGPQDYPVSDFCGIRYQKHWAIQKGEWLPIEISRGCAFSCKFCNFFKRDPNFKNVETLKDELLRNYELYGTTGYHFSDDCFNDNYQKVVTLTDMFAKLPFKLEWVSYVRTDLCHRHPDVADRMLENGARGFFWGIESLSHAAARFAGKPLGPEIVKEILQTIRNKAGTDVLMMGSFIIGLPKETVETLQETLDWIKTQDVLDGVVFFPLEASGTARPEVDGIVDYSDYTKNPKRYGFEELNGSYWKHATLDSVQAKAICAQWNAALKGYSCTKEKQIFSYPRVRSMGFSHEESRELLENRGYDPIKTREEKWIAAYHQELQSYIG